MRLRKPVRAAGAALARLGTLVPATSANGAGRDGWRDAAPDLPIRAPSMDARFRRLCAVFPDGRCLIAEGYEPDDRLRLDLVALRESGAVPPVLAEESVPLEEIAALWRAGEAEGTAGGGAAARRVERLLEDAAHARASDVVFEQGRDSCGVYAIVNDRKLPLCAPLTPEEGRRVMGFLFHCKDEGSSQTSYRRASFQGFSIRAGGAVPLPGGISALRCERGPHDPDADHLFARLFYTDRLDEDMTLERLGFSAEEAALFAEIRMAMQGGVFIGGRAGDGKSTTLAVNLALQMAEMSGQLNLVTLEDPVEYRIPGAIQIAVPTAGAGETRAGHFKEALMHFCRVHPASGMVSEIRDADAARQVLQCVDTGHQIWTTIHVHNANAIPFRLIDMGVGAAEVAKPGNVALLMKQTLLPRLCPACALDRPAGGRAVPEGLISRLGGLDGLRFRNAEGCEECRREGGGEVSGTRVSGTRVSGTRVSGRSAAGTSVSNRAWNGYLGQTAVAETIRPDAGYLRYVREGDPLGAWAWWRREMGGVPIGVRIRAMVKEGAVDPFDALLKGGAGEHEAQADPVAEERRSGGGAP